MVTSQQLDASVIRFQSQPEAIDKLLNHLQSQQELLMDVLIGSHAELLTEEELDYLLFLFLVIYSTFQQQSIIPIYSEDQIIQAEEASWQIINEFNNYEDALSAFYTNIKNEELMEFIDLSIAPDDENEINITDPGRLILLAVLTSLSSLLSN